MPTCSTCCFWYPEPNIVTLTGKPNQILPPLNPIPKGRCKESAPFIGPPQTIIIAKDIDLLNLEDRDQLVQLLREATQNYEVGIWPVTFENTEACGKHQEKV